MRSLAASLLLDAKPTTYRSLQGWVTCLPMGLDLHRDAPHLRHQSRCRRRSRSPRPTCPPPDPTSVAAPCRGALRLQRRLPGPGALGPVRRGCTTTTSVILGRSGAGKSYLVKLELLRSLYRGIEIAVIDPEDEYARLARAVGGTYVHLGAEGVRLNPFDLPIHTHRDGRRTAPRDALSAAACSCTPSSPCCSAASRTPPNGPRWTARSPPPTSRRDHRRPAHLDPARAARCGPCATNWPPPATPATGPRPSSAARLHPYVEGAFKQLFDGPTTTTPDGHLVVFSPAGSARRTQAHRHPADAGRGVAAGVQPGHPPPAAGRRRRGVAADERARRRGVPVPHGQSLPQTLGRA